MTKIIGSIQAPTSLEGRIENKSQINVEVIGSGPRGKSGKSAYEIWLEQGNSGTESDFLGSLAAGQLEAGESIRIEDSVIRTATFVHEQIYSAFVWEVQHNLKKFPSVTVIDTGGNVMVGSITYLDDNNLIITFSHEFSGVVYLN